MTGAFTPTELEAVEAALAAYLDRAHGCEPPSMLAGAMDALELARRLRVESVAARPRLRQTYTFVTLDVPAAFYDLVRGRLLEAGYGHAVDDKAGTLDMHGLALTREGET